jgi:hypothetical protein
VDVLLEMECGEAFGCGVAEAGDGEGAGEFGEAAEVCAWVGGFALLAFEGVVDGEWLLAAESVGETLADAEVGAVFEGSGGWGIEDADLDAVFAVGLWLECAAARVAHLPNEDGRLSQVELVALNVEVVLMIRNVLVNAELGLRSTLVLNLNLKMEGRNSFKSDWNNLLAFCFPRAVAVRLSRLVETSTWARVDLLPNSDGRELLLRVVVLGVSKLIERVLVVARLCSVASNGCSATCNMEFLFLNLGILASPILKVLTVVYVKGSIS